MSTTANKNSAKVGDVLTVLGAITLPDPERGDVSAVRQRGYVFTLTDALYEATKDRRGISVFDDLSDESQSVRWGEPKLTQGDQSETVLWWQGDSSSALLARDHEMANADRIVDYDARVAAHLAIREKFKNADINPSNQFTVYRVAPESDNRGAKDAR